MAEVVKIGADEYVHLVVLKATGAPIEGGAHTTSERAWATVEMLERDYPSEVGWYDVKAVQIEW